MGIVAYFGRDYQRASGETAEGDRDGADLCSGLPLARRRLHGTGPEGEVDCRLRACGAYFPTARRWPSPDSASASRAPAAKEAEAIRDELLGASPGRYVPEFYVACLYGALHQKDEAFEWLDRAYREHANGLNLIQVSPLVDDLRSDPRFSELLTRLRLSHP